MGAPASIETSRLRLVRPAAADADEIFARYAADADVTQYVGWPRHRTVADTQAFLQFSDQAWGRDPAGPYLMRLRDGNSLIGSTGLMFDSPRQASTGYVVAKDSWGQGYATEALGAMVDLARGLGVMRLYALCHPAHHASWRVLEKCGFTLEGAWPEHAEFPNLAPGVLSDVLCYALDMKGR